MNEPTSRYTRLVAPEFGLALGCALAVLLMALPAMLGIWVGMVLTAVSLLAGAIAGTVYHLRLHQALAPMPRGWYWRPMSFHDQLDRAQRQRVMPWFIAGATGCGLAFLGCAAFLSATLRL